mmetsp:Transcript_13769/g.32156  ORF Transcript_13769/g.32156 Transcript_13769/m.32156 type:complete len:265 (-) Transcript_13769:472-1266(-)
MKRLLVVGDSDIAYWPKELLPSPSDNAVVSVEKEWNQPLVSGHSGATLSGVVPHLKSVLAESLTNSVGNGCAENNERTGTSSGEKDDVLVVVACAGENDIGEGLSLEKSVKALQDFADAIFLDDKCGDDRFLVFLGPKFEPWLEDDPSYKKKYEAMTRAFRRCLEEYETKTIIDNDSYIKTSKGNPSTISSNDSNSGGGRIHFIDCLTMFCGETANVPGARLGGRAKADPLYFRSDKLHLSKKGYEVWKEVVETTIRGFLPSSN